MMPEQESFLEKLYHEHFQELAVYANYYLRDWEEAHIAAQETFRIALEKIEALEASPNPVGWLKNTVKNVCRNMMKKEARRARREVPLESLYPDDPKLSYEMQPEISFSDLREHMSEEDFYLLQRLAVDGASYVDVAGEFGISAWACRKRKKRIEQYLKKFFEEDR